MLKLLLLFLSFTFLAPTSAHSLQTARQLSFAGSGGLNPNGVDAINLNPASLNIHAGFDFGGGYNFGDVTDTVENTGYYVWFKDSVSSAFQTERNKKVKKAIDGLSGFPVAAAFAYSDLKLEGENSDTVLDYTNYILGLSTLVTKRISVGITAAYFDGASGQGFKESFTNIDIGVLYWVLPSLKLGLSGLDVLTTVEERFLEELNPQRARFSAAYNVARAFVVYADVEGILSGDLEGDFNYGIGIETALKEFLSFRIGAFKNQALDAYDFGAGLSFTGPKLQIHYGFRQNNGADTFLNSIDLSVPLW